MKFIPALLALITLPVFAGTNVCPPSKSGTQSLTCGKPNITPQVTIVDTNTTNRNVLNNTSFVQGGTGGNSRATGGNASASAVGSVSQNVNFATPKIPDNTPDTALAVPPATAPCRIAVGVGGSSPGLGVMLGFSTLDEGCDTREDVRTLWAVGLQSAAYARLCQKPEMAKAMGTLCQKEEQAPAPVSSISFVH